MNSKKPKRERDDDDEDGIDEGLLGFQKKAIYLHMEEYKRKYLGTLEINQELEGKFLKSSESLNQVLSYWTMIEAIAGLTASKLSGLVGSPDLIDQSIEQSFEKIKISLNVPLSFDFSVMQQDSLLDGQLALEIASKEAMKLRLETITEALNVAEKKLNRMELKQKLHGEPAQVILEVPKVEMQAEVQDNDQVEELKALAEQRALEIKSLTREKFALQREIDALMIALAESKTMHETEKELRYQLSLQEPLRDDLENALVEIEMLQSQRRLYLDTITHGEEKRKKALEEDLKKSENDLGRLRSHRDTLQKSLDGLSAKDSFDSKYLVEIESLASNRKERITTLESELARMKIVMVSNSGERGLMEFLRVVNEDPYKVTSAALESALRKVSDLQELVEKMQESKGYGKTLQAEQEKSLALEGIVLSYRERFGTLDQPSDSALLVAQKVSEMMEFRSRFESSQIVEKKLQEEIDILGKAWSRLEEQNNSKVMNLGAREEQVKRLIHEKSKLEHKVTVMTKQTLSLQNMGVAQKRQSEKQLEQIRKLELLEKAMGQQLRNLEQINASYEPNLEKEKRKANLIILKMSEMKDEFERMRKKGLEQNRLLLEKTDQLELEILANSQSQEQFKVVSKRLEALRRDSTDPQMQSQLDSYRLLLMCQSCNNQFKSHVLLKCMHTFCKGCIDDMYNSRQRKCPTCAIPFGNQDVKQVYL